MAETNNPIKLDERETLRQAEDAADEERNMTVREAFKYYRKAVLWSVVLSTALIMEGYDVVIINSFWAQPAFLHRFGKTTPDGKQYIPANWQGALNNAASIGQVIGLSLNGYCQARFGSRRTYMCAMVAMAAAIFIPVFSTSLEMLFAGELVCGIPWGIFQTLTTAYAADIIPIPLRGYLTSYVNICWGIGLTIGASVVRASLAIEGDWAWRMPFVIQWVWPIPLFMAAYFAPENPWWLVRRGHHNEAARTICRLGRADFMTSEKARGRVAMMGHTLEVEKRSTEGGGFKELFRGTNLRRTEIACVIWAAQYWCGQPISNFATSFLTNAGMAEERAFDINIANFCMIFVGTIFAWFGLYRYGRRFMYLFGLAFMGLLFAGIGILGCLPRTNNASLGIGILMITITFVFGISVAPACYSIVGEVPSARVRAQTVVLARICYILSQAALQQLFPRFLTPRPDGWDIGGKSGFIFVGTNALLFVYCFFRLPETMGRTFGELDILFHTKVPARSFKSTIVNEFEDSLDAAIDLPDIKSASKGDTEHVERL